MNKDSIKIVEQEQKYKILIRSLRKQQEEKNNEKTNLKETNSNKSN